MYSVSMLTILVFKSAMAYETVIADDKIMMRMQNIAAH